MLTSATNALGQINHAIDYLAIAIISVEIIFLSLKHRKLVYGDTYTNLAVGAFIFIFIKIMEKGIALAAMLAAAKYAFFHFEHNIYTVVLTVLIADFCYYCFHRLAHTRPLFLLEHCVHHSSEEFDFSTNLRVSFIATFYAWIPLLLPILMGFDPILIMAAATLSNGFPFFLHNKYVQKLGPLEWIFNTPSHHRVHHGKNLAYIDKNFGGLFIIWDRLFGTFAEEKEPVIYGVRGIEPTRNPAKLLFIGWPHLFSRELLAKSQNSNKV